MKESFVSGARLTEWPVEYSTAGESANSFAGELLGQARIVGMPVTARKGARCPSCDSIIYSRRHVLCGVCGCQLPESCLFNFSQAACVERTLEEERQRHRAWLRKANEMTSWVS